MRFAALACSGLFLLAACEQRQPAEPASPPAPEQQTPVEALLSDELPGLSAPATGVAFWEHPSLPYNGLLIVANQNGLVSYNMDDGNEVSRIDGFNAHGAAVSYLGFGAQAAGFLAFFDEADSIFRFYGIDNASRAFLPLSDGPAIRGAVRGFCLGRAQTADAPTLFVVQNAKVQLFNLAADADGVAVAGEASVDTPDDLVSCTVGHDGVLVLVASDGALYRLEGENAFATAFATTEAQTAGDIDLIASTIGEGDDSSLSGQLLLLDTTDGAVHVIDSESGANIGVVNFAGTANMPGASPATVMAASSANLGSLYRSGILGFGAVSEEGPVVRITPTSSVLNALSLDVGNPVSSRGGAPATDDGLIITVPDFGAQPD